MYSSGPAPPRTRSTGLLLVVPIVLVVVAAGFAIWSVVAFLSAGSDLNSANRAWSAANDRLVAVRADDDLAFTRARDEVNRVGQAAVVTLNSLDYRTVDEGLAAWEEVTTGALHENVVDLKEQSKQAIVEAESVTTAAVLSSAVRELDERAGKATVMVAIKMTVVSNGAEPTEKYQRIEGSLTRTEAGWKLDHIGVVPIATAGS